MHKPKPCVKVNPRISHADESEFFSRMEFAEIASALFNVFGFARVFYSEISLLNMSSIIKYSRRIASFINFSRDGVNPGKKSLIPAFCDLYGIKYTGSNAFVISLLRNKRIYGDILSKNGIPVPITYEFLPDRTTQADILDVFNGLDILMKNIDESASIGLTPHCKMRLSHDSYQQFYNTATAVNSKRVLVQEFIAGPECEVLVVKYQGQYLALDPVEIVFLMIRNSWIPKSQTPIDTHSSYWRELPPMMFGNWRPKLRKYWMSRIMLASTLE